MLTPLLLTPRERYGDAHARCAALIDYARYGQRVAREEILLKMRVIDAVMKNTTVVIRHTQYFRARARAHAAPRRRSRRVRRRHYFMLPAPPPCRYCWRHDGATPMLPLP